MKKPEKCCDPGDYKCQIPMPIYGRRRDIDFCIADIVTALNAANITTMASCCGHGKQNGSIALEDGREIVIREFSVEDHNHCIHEWETMSGKIEFAEKCSKCGEER